MKKRWLEKIKWAINSIANEERLLKFNIYNFKYSNKTISLMKNHLENITREPENKNDINREDEIGRGVRRKFDIIVISSSISTGVIGIGKIFVGSVIGNDGYNGLGYGKCIESTALSALYLFVRPEYKPRDN